MSLPALSDPASAEPWRRLSWWPRPDPGALLTDAEIDALTEPELDEYLTLDAEIEGTERLEAFMGRVSPALPPPRHLKPIIDLLELAKRRRVQVCISMPPRHGKTWLIQHAIAWWLARNPADTHGYYSYNADQGLDKSMKIRDLAQAAGVKLSPDYTAKALWRTSVGGGLLAGGVGSKLTGQGISGLMVVDDPFKDRKQADSATRRADVWEWFNEVVYTRMEGASIFVIHTRWHEDDLIGRLKKLNEESPEDPPWIIVNLAALAEAANDNGTGEDVLARAPDEALWASNELYNDIAMAKIRRQIGEFSFAALYQGQPRPRGEKVFGVPHYYTREELALLHGFQVVIAADPAGTEKTSSDYSAIVALAIVGSGDETVAYVLDVYHQRVSIPQFATDLLAFQRKHGNAPVHIESVGGFKAIPQMLKKINSAIRVREIPMTEGDKFTRAQGVAAAWKDARVLVPLAEVDGADVPWLGEFLDELNLFTGVKDAHDDQVDALAHAWNSVKKPWKGAKVRTAAPRRI